MPATEKPFTLAFRIPQWAKNYQVKGIEGAKTEEKAGSGLEDSNFGSECNFSIGNRCNSGLLLLFRWFKNNLPHGRRQSVGD